jgi:hypothetical protein
MEPARSISCTGRNRWNSSAIRVVATRKGLAHIPRPSEYSLSQLRQEL